MFPISIIIGLLSTPIGAQGFNLDAVISVDVRQGQEFQGICMALRIPCGIEIDDDLIQNAGGTFVVRKRKAREALRSALKRYPNHEWTYHDGLLDVHPQRVLANNPLSASLGKVEFINKDLQALLQLLLDKTKLSTAAEPYPFVENANPRHFSFVLDKPTARQVLNTAVVHHAHAAWVTHHTKRSLIGATTRLVFFDYELESRSGDATK